MKQTISPRTDSFLKAARLLSGIFAQICVIKFLKIYNLLEAKREKRAVIIKLKREPRELVTNLNFLSKGLIRQPQTLCVFLSISCPHKKCNEIIAASANYFPSITSICPLWN